MLTFFVLWFFSSCASYFALILHVKKELGKNYDHVVAEGTCFVYALMLGPVPLFLVIIINIFRLVRKS